MKKITLSALAVVALTSFGFAGGDIEPVSTPMVMEEMSTNSFYVGAGVAVVSAREATTSLSFFDGENGQDRLGNLTLLAGYNYNQYIAAEARYTTSVAYDDGMDMNAWSLFVKPQYPVSDAFSIYALLGFGGVSLDGGTNLNPMDVDDTGFQWGLGLSYAVTNNVDLFIDYTSLANDMEDVYYYGLEYDTDALTLGMTYSF